MFYISGKIKNQSSYIIREGYPTGRRIRGALGYIALEGDLKVKELFKDIEDDRIVFRDALPLCPRDSGIMVDNADTFVCLKCGNSIKKWRSKGLIVRVDRDTKKAFSSPVEIFENSLTFRLSISIVDESFLKDIKAILEYWKENWIGIGKRSNKGFGNFKLVDYSIFKINYRSVKPSSNIFVPITPVVLPIDRSYLLNSLNKLYRHFGIEPPNNVNIKVPFASPSYTVFINSYLINQNKSKSRQVKVGKIKTSLKIDGIDGKFATLFRLFGGIGKFYHLGFGEVR